ncbi:MAG TPA: glycosyltransferase, partial [Thermomicrobiales bacterium]|nr:glycosyltransferase [Thermomicrobiales bacterium]
KPATQPILGRIERPGRTPDVVTEKTVMTAGWAVSRAGIFAVKLLIDGAERATAEYGGLRPDVQALFPDYPDAEHSGFIGEALVNDLPDGFHSLTIRIIGRDGAAAEVTTTFERDSTAFDTGRILARTDKPTAGTTPTVRDRLHVQGWALSSRGIRSVTALLDGEPRGLLSYGLLRPDLGASHPDFPDADHSGFGGVVPVDGLADGPHELTVRIAAGTDLSHDLVLPFVVDTSQPPIGETPEINRQYPEWLAKFAPTDASLAALRTEATILAYQPTFSLALAAGDIDPAALAATIDSVVAQAYPNWRLAIAVARDAALELRAALAERAAREPRIEIVETDQGDFVEAFAAALERGTGEYVAVVPAGDIVWPSALAAVVRDLQAQPGVDLIYGDEDKIDLDAGVQWDPYFKPDWSPDLLLSTDYFGPLTFFRTPLARAVADLGQMVEGSETYDLALRAAERAGLILHVPKLLLSRRAVLTPEPSEPDAPTVAAQQAALAAALARRGVDAAVEPGISPGRWRVRYALQDTPGVTVVMPSGGKMQYLRPCLDDLIDRTTYPNLHILVLDNSDSFEVAALCDQLALRFPRLRREPVDLKPFNFSALINRALPFVETPYVILLNDDITVVTPDWVEAMLEHAQRPDVGIVGPKLLYPDGTLQHVGVVLGPFDGTVHAFKQFPGDAKGWHGLPNVVRNYSAVTFACAMMRTSLFAEVGGLDEENLPIAFNDVDFCLRTIEAGYRVVYTPHAVLFHHESVTKKAITNPSEVARLRSRWGHVIAHDPYYSPNLTRMGEDCSLNMG